MDAPIIGSSFIGVLIAALSASALGCQQEPVKPWDKPLLPVMTKHQLQTIQAKGWKVQRWVAYTFGGGGEPVDVWVRITPLEAAAKTQPKAKAFLSLNHKDPMNSRTATIDPEFQDCSKLPKRLEHARWGQDTEEHEFPPKELCWEARIKDPFNSNAREKPEAKRLANGVYDLDVKIDLQLEGVAPFVSSPIRIEIDSKGGRGK